MLAATLVLAGVAAAAVTGVLGDSIFGASHVGDVVNGRVLLQTNQWISPYGKRTLVTGRLVLNGTVSPNGNTVALSEQGGVLEIHNASTGAVIQSTTMSDGTAGQEAPVYSPDGKFLWVAQQSHLIRYTVAENGTVSAPVSIAMSLPTGIAYSEDGSKLYVALNGTNKLAVIANPAGTPTVSKEIPIGNAPRGVVVVGNKAYVANEGGRPAKEGDTTNKSYGTAMVSDPTTGATTTGTVSVVNLEKEEEASEIKVGLQPTVEYLDGTALFVANSNDDSVSIIETSTGQVTQTFNVNVVPGAKVGSYPNGITMPDAHHILISIGRDNAIAEYGYNGPKFPVRYEGLIPTDSYPVDVDWDAPLKTVIVTNMKGIGTRGTPNSASTANGGSLGRNTLGANNTGSMTTFELPSPSELSDLTHQVFLNNNWEHLKTPEGSDRGEDTEEDQPGGGMPAIPRRLGEPSPIKHVMLIIKENRTYDQILGDIGKGESDPALVNYGESVTPNAHAMSNQFSLFDNFYDEGMLSADGHNWLMQGDVNDYNERQYGASARSYPYNGGDALVYQRDGFIWNAAERAHKTVRNYGEYEPFFNPEEPSTPSWLEYWHDAEVMEGKVEGPLDTKLSNSYSDIPSLNKISDHAFPLLDLSIPDVYRTDLWEQEFSEQVKKNTFPDLTIMQMGDDHTGGPEGPTEDVADNDEAIGRIVDDVSHSKYWKSTAIFMLEDDTQAGVDHVDGHRGPLYIASPYVRHGAIDSEYFTQLNVDRTIEQILGMQPMNQEDLAAEPMYSAFTNKPNLAPFNYIENEADVAPPKPPAPPTKASCETQAPKAEATTAKPELTSIVGEEGEEVVPGDTYYAVTNGCVQADIVTRIAPNGGRGTFEPGWLGDFFLRDKLHQEEFDWSALELSTHDYVTAHNKEGATAIWGNAPAYLGLPNISVENGNTVVASGVGLNNSSNESGNIQATMRTTAVAGAPELKDSITLHNTGTTEYHGFLHYQMDPDTSDETYIPGISGANPGVPQSGWTANYLFHEDAASLSAPVDGLAWPAGEPVEAPEGQSFNGATYGIWFNVDIPAGGEKTITWYLIQSYKGEVQADSNIVQWVNQLNGATPTAAQGLIMQAKIAKAKAKSTVGLIKPSVPARLLPPKGQDSAESLATTGAPKKYRAIAAAWVKWMHKQHLTGRHPVADSSNPAQFNRLDWYLTRKWKTPYPGDKRILPPTKVPGGNMPAGFLGEG